MGGRIIVVLAIIIIIISSTGIFLTKKQDEKINNPNKEIKLTDVEMLVLVKDIKKGEVISEQDVKAEKRNVTLDYIKDSFIIDKPVTFVIGSSANKDLQKDVTLKYEDITKPVEIVDDSLSVSTNGDLAFNFPLASREYNVLRGVKKGTFVDVYFKYEKKTKNDDTGIVSKPDEISKQQSKENANLSNLVLLFKDKRVLNIKDIENVSDKTGIDPTSKGIISLQMEPREIKSVYAIENLGSFYIFPAEHGNGKSSNVSTKKILSKDFIKELRGGNK